MNVSIVGSGYVGTTLAVCLAHLGHDVVTVDVDEDVVASLDAGTAPIHEPGLQELLDDHGDRIRATTDYAAVPETDLTFLCLPTPSADDGTVDLRHVEAAARSLGAALAETAGDHVVVVKSTVVPSTTETVVGPAIEERSGKRVGEALALAMNPEFLREGRAVHDLLHPDKLVVGTADERARARLLELYEPLLAETTLVETGVREAEMMKYANNAFLASKVSLVNELGNVCKELDVDAYEVMDAVGLDHRISSKFLRSGLGWGGSCFPKDVDALRAVARGAGYEPALLDAVVGVNDGQPRRAVDLLARHLSLDGRPVAVLGLAFKPGTDDVRNSRAIDVVAALLERGADVVAYDPVAMENAREVFPHVEYAASATSALDAADAAVIATDWEEFADLDYGRLGSRVVVDGRRMDVDTAALDVYEGLCW